MVKQMIIGAWVACLALLVFFSSRRRHTRCALVTGVQTCALPIYRVEITLTTHDAGGLSQRDLDLGRFVDAAATVLGARTERSEERRVGTECVSTCRSEWPP